MATEHPSPLLTQEEAIAWLRLDESGGPSCPEASLKRYRDIGLLKCVRVGRSARYHIDDLRAFLDRLRERGDR